MFSCEKKKNTRFGAILNVYYLKCKICDREKDHALNLLILYTVKQENLTHTYFSAKASTYTLVQINFCTHTFFKKKSFFFCLLNPATGFYFVFDQARKHIGFDFLSYIGKLSMETINLLLYHQSVERKKRHLWIMFCLLLVKKLELSDFEFDIATVKKPDEFLDETRGKNESHHL